MKITPVYALYKSRKHLRSRLKCLVGTVGVAFLMYPVKTIEVEPDGSIVWESSAYATRIVAPLFTIGGRARIMLCGGRRLVI